MTVSRRRTTRGPVHPVELTRDGLPRGFLAPVGARRATRFRISAEGIATVTLARPGKLNAFDERMIREVRAALWECAFRPRVRVIIITGAGRGFCAGRDIAGLDYENHLPSPQYRAYVRANHEMLDDIEAIEKPVMAVVNGVCAGGGLELAAACDFRLAASTAEFLLPENQLGVLPASGACSRLTQMIGIGRLKEMAMTGRPVGASEALAIGLVHRVHPGDRLLGEATAFARVLLDRAPLALGMVKHIINTCQSTDLETGRVLERLGQSLLIQTEDNVEGMAAFREKRKPRFRGK